MTMQPILNDAPSFGFASEETAETMTRLFRARSSLSDHLNFDLIISNPPYVPNERIASLQNSVKNYEPILALDGGKDGTEIINKIILQLPKFQKKINCLIEIDDSHNLDKIKSEGLNPSLIKDQFGVNRFLSLFLL